MFVSYAQNFEDVMLWRALKHVNEGVYIDIGAQDPISDSVSRAFSERGWRGVHVEPSRYYADKLRNEYPNDVIIEALIGEGLGLADFFEIAGTGLSTAQPDFAGRHAAMGREVKTQSALVVRLATVLDEWKDRDIHWLKIDVEGHERSVISSWKPSNVRPWVVVVESIDPISLEDNSHLWELDLCDLGYELVYRDGLNRFYLSRQRSNLKPAFEVGPNIFDGFSLSGTSSSPFCVVQTQKLKEHVAREAELMARLEAAAAEQQRASAKIRRLSAEHDAREAELMARLDSNLQEITRLHRVIFEQATWGEASVQHVGQLSDEISALRNSASWRLTRPMRSLGKMVHKAVRRMRLKRDGFIRRTLRSIRRRLRRLYGKFTASRFGRRLYGQFPRPADLQSITDSQSRTIHVDRGDPSLAPLAPLEPIEHRPTTIEAALLAAISKTPTGRRIHV